MRTAQDLDIRGGLAPPQKRSISDCVVLYVQYVTGPVKGAASIPRHGMLVVTQKRGRGARALRVEILMKLVFFSR